MASTLLDEGAPVPVARLVSPWVVWEDEQAGDVLEVSPRAIYPDEWPRWEGYVARPTVELVLVVCAWCKTLMGLQAHPAGGELAGMDSHGCCQACLAGLLEEVA